MWCLNKPYAIVCSMQIFYAVAVVLSGIIFFGKKNHQLIFSAHLTLGFQGEAVFVCE